MNKLNLIIFTMQGIIVFASVMATLGFQVILESGRELITQVDVLQLNLIIIDSICLMKYVFLYGIINDHDPQWYI